jgi:hypothetical protein
MTDLVLLLSSGIHEDKRKHCMIVAMTIETNLRADDGMSWDLHLHLPPYVGGCYE